MAENSNNNEVDDQIQQPAAAAADHDSSSSGNVRSDQPKTQYTRLIPYKQLEISTDNYNPKLITRVFKGDVKFKSIDKILLYQGPKALKERNTEIEMITRLRHPNIIKLFSCSIDLVNPELLVYEYMPHSLHDLLHGFDETPEVKPLDWNKRMVIANGVAKALDYLHNDARPPVLCMDLTAENILLNDDFQPKISDFAIAISVTGDQVNNSSDSTESVVMDRKAYSAPECYNNGKITTKCDVYSFGVVLMELITGLLAHDGKRENEKHYLPDAVRHSVDYVKLADPRLDGEFDEAIFCRVMELGLKCTEDDPDSRPDMRDVVRDTDAFESEKYEGRKEEDGGGKRI